MSLNPNYVERVQRNLRDVIVENGGVFYKGTPSVTSRMLYRIERGESIPTIKSLQLLANDLGFDMLELFRK
jgi:transcriptional regulator with XRE-family HTH domain